MARFDTHLKRLEKRLQFLESEKLQGSIIKALQEHGKTGKLPDHPGLRKVVLKYIRAAQYMSETLPQTTKSEGDVRDSSPSPPGKLFPQE